ncbi:MAG: heme exporter protein CcmD [Octadecabacter sp.]|nr:heme exporter protein CcmD [Octadecabacter sp.]
MIPDLGIYAVEVTSAYVLSISLLITILVLSLLRARKIRAQLLKVEASRLLNNV